MLIDFIQSILVVWLQKSPNGILNIHYYKGVTHSLIDTNIKALLCCDVLTKLVKM